MSILKELKFNLIGEYFLNDDGEVDVKPNVEKLSAKDRLVYLFAVEDKIMYVGSTKRGYKRPLRYHSNINKKNKLRKVHSGIKVVLDSGEKIQVYARIFEKIEMEFEGLSLNPFLAYEEALIDRFDPEWNQEKKSDKSEVDVEGKATELKKEESLDLAEDPNADDSLVMMQSPPENLCVGHNLAYIYLYTAKYNDWNITTEELQETYQMIKYWMGDDTSNDELKEILIETDVWFQSGSNMERTIMLENIINMLYNSEEFPNKFFPDIFEDCIRVTAANNQSLAKKIPKLPSRINLSQKELVDLIDEYPVLLKMQKFLRLQEK
jgi:hypothetical protein